MLGQALDPGMKEGFGLFLGHGPGEGFGCLGPGSEQPPGDEGENGDQGIEQDEEKTDDGSKEKGQLVRMAGGVDLRVDFGKRRRMSVVPPVAARTAVFLFGIKEAARAVAREAAAALTRVFPMRTAERKSSRRERIFLPGRPAASPSFPGNQGCAASRR